MTNNQKKSTDLLHSINKIKIFVCENINKQFKQKYLFVFLFVQATFYSKIPILGARVPSIVA